MKDKQQFTIDSEAHYQGIRSILSKESQKPGILRLLMRAMEAYRSARKYGWSRPWNKYGVMNVQSFRIRPLADTQLIAMAIQTLQREIPDIPREIEGTIHELLLDKKKLMGFLFVQETTDPDGSLFEGINISLGRVNAKRYRDRLDIIIESPMTENKTQGPTRVRVYLDPYDKGRKDPLWTYQENEIKSEQTKADFESLAAISWEWANSPSRIWDHWTSKYIDYFGPRQWNPLSTYFYHEIYPEARVPTKAPDWAIEPQAKEAC